MNVGMNMGMNLRMNLRMNVRIASQKLYIFHTAAFHLNEAYITVYNL
jgi:hypothetical protein